MMLKIKKNILIYFKVKLFLKNTEILIVYLLLWCIFFSGKYIKIIFFSFDINISKY
jgi:hypothetical protein